MAKAHLNEKVVQVVQEEQIVLTLSREEAEIVMAFAGHANLNKSDFKDGASSIYTVLRDALGVNNAIYHAVELSQGISNRSVVWKRKS